MYWFEKKNGKTVWFDGQREKMLADNDNLVDGIYYYPFPLRPQHMKSGDQVRFIHKIFDILDKDKGDEKGTAKKRFKRKYLTIPRDEILATLTENFEGTESERIEYVAILDEAMSDDPVTISIARLRMKEAWEFIDNLIRDAAIEYNVVIETPVDGVPKMYRKKAL